MNKAPCKTDADHAFINECRDWFYSFPNEIESSWEEHDSLSKLHVFVQKTESEGLVSQSVVHASFGHTRGVHFIRSQMHTIFNFRRSRFSKSNKHEFGLTLDSVKSVYNHRFRTNIVELAT